MNDDNVSWFTYLFIILITTFIVSIITEKVVINKLNLMEGVEINQGRCRLKKGYGKLIKE